MDQFRACVDGAVVATDPDLVPGVDADTRKLVFDTMVEGCEEIRGHKFASLEAR